jgi:glycosyltransferase involved in cell wall biosynthesis
MRAAGPTRFLVLTRQTELGRREAAAAGVSETVIVLAASPNDVPSYLSAADGAIAFVRPCPSKSASSPTKIAEYLACGLPVVANDGVGDLSELSTEPAFVLLQALDADSLNRGSAALLARIGNPQCREAARDVALRRFSLDAAVQQYAAIYRTLTPRERG